MADLIASRRFYLGSNGRGEVDPLSVMNRMFAPWFCADRFNILNKYSPFRIAKFDDRLPPSKKLDIADICDKRAFEIIAMGKPVVVLWSGGVDSTAIIVSLLKNNIPLDQLTVSFSSMTKTEYPWYMNELKRLGVRLEEHEQIPEYVNTLSDTTIVNGWCADQLFGSDVHRFNPDLYHENWMTGIRQMMLARNIHLTESSFEVLESVYSDYAQQLGFELNQFCEFAWLYNFCIKWSFVREAGKLVCEKKSIRDNMVNFFETDDFQSWSVNNFENLHKENVFKNARVYKYPLKKYIFDYNKDEDFFLNKPKVNSRSSVRQEAKKIFILDTDGYHVFQLKNAEPNASNHHRLSVLLQQRYLKDEFK